MDLSDFLEQYRDEILRPDVKGEGGFEAWMQRMDMLHRRYFGESFSVEEYKSEEEIRDKYERGVTPMDWCVELRDEYDFEVMPTECAEWDAYRNEGKEPRV